MNARPMPAGAGLRRPRRGPRGLAASTRCSPQLDRELVGLQPVKTRIREIAALLLVDRARRTLGLARRPAVAAHELHRQSRHRQDHGRDAHGRDPAPARLRAQGPPGRGDARRPRRPVHRPHRAEDQGGAEARDGRRAVHRRGLLPLPARERARLRPGGDRDPAAGDGEPARRPGGDPRRLQGPHGDLLPLQPRPVVAHRAPHRLPRLRVRTSCCEIAERMLAQQHYRLARRRARRARASTSSCAARSRTSPTRARSATRSTARACARPAGSSPPARARCRARR